ncbi:hypothetical protein Hte_006990 [Hypoxylon texense]
MHWHITYPVAPVEKRIEAKQNPNIGKNLYLHPICPFNAVFDKDVIAWGGQMITSVLTQFDDLDGKGHGPRIEPMAMTTLQTMWTTPWHSGLQFKIDALKHRQMNGFASFTRDRDPGQRRRRPERRRPPSQRTRCRPSTAPHVLVRDRGRREAVLHVPRRVPRSSPMVHGFPRFRSGKPRRREEHRRPRTSRAGRAACQAADLHPASAVFASAHQMGSCRMSTSPAAGVVDEHGKVWGTEDLYVADASVFPSASGDNPMITIMAITDYIARGISQEM